MSTSPTYSGTNPAGDRHHTSMRDVKDDVSRLKNDVTSMASDAAHKGIDTVSAGAERAMDVGRQAAHSVKSGHSRMCEYVSEHPTTSVLLAAGIGALLARVLSR